MRAEVTRRGRTVKVVTVSDIDHATTSDAEIVDAALEAAHETRSSLFGIHLERHHGGTATVALHTD